jgi:hypothetical protein
MANVLESARTDLDKYIRATRSRMRPAVQRLVRDTDGQIAEFAGQFVWGIIKGAGGT